ncbi:hypothetical protein [Pantoea sp. GbtcB22]|uniref:hypothetical protein n=1 Tax=Pantoea sp. GbtcB22 TaxID=2824767 RepID=UPI001C2F698C|nr:hypothetical protein [Pantoea sp. GbtcB22]
MKSLIWLMNKASAGWCNDDPGTVRLFRGGEFKKGKNRAGAGAPLMAFRQLWPSQTFRLVDSLPVRLSWRVSLMVI